MDQLANEACFARRGADGQTLIEANGFIGAAFRHRTSRAGDPQLHTHVVVPNLVQGSRRPVVGPRWPPPLRLEEDRRHPLPVGPPVRAGPAGPAWEVRRNGLSELADIPKPILRAFSNRRVEIEAALETRGVTSARAAAQAALATRAAKPDGAATDLSA